MVKGVKNVHQYHGETVKCTNFTDSLGYTDNRKAVSAMRKTVEQGDHASVDMMPGMTIVCDFGPR
jgi:hypothetical protein